MSTDRDSFMLLDAAVPEQRVLWLNLWRAWPQRDVAAHPGYAPLFARPQDRAICACQMGTEGGILFPIIIRPLRTEPWGVGEGVTCDLISPYGYGGPFGWGSFKVEAFWAEFERWARAICAVSLLTRFSLFKDHLIPFCGDTREKGRCVIVSLTQEPDSMLMSYEKSVRENVRQAKRAGVTIEPDPDHRRLDEFLSVYYFTMNRLGAPQKFYFTKLFFETLIAELPNQVLLFHALHNQRVLSTELLLISENHLYPFLGGTLEEGRSLRANPLLRHGVNLWGIAHGKQHVILGGGYLSEQDSLLCYKQRFAPNGSVSFNVGTRIYDSHSYQALIEKRTSWEHEQGNQWSPSLKFFPAYRS